MPKLGPDDLGPRGRGARRGRARARPDARAAAHRWTFRAALYAPSGRPLLVDNVRRLRRQAAQYEAALGAGAVRTTRDERALLASLRAGRSDEAVERLRRSIDRPRAAVAALLGRRASRPSGPRRRT
jgi:DNA-binding GntR family transcriptional regulator